MYICTYLIDKDGVCLVHHTEVIRSLLDDILRRASREKDSDKKLMS